MPREDQRRRFDWLRRGRVCARFDSPLFDTIQASAAGSSSASTTSASRRPVCRSRSAVRHPLATGLSPRHDGSSRRAHGPSGATTGVLHGPASLDFWDGDASARVRLRPGHRRAPTHPASSTASTPSVGAAHDQGLAFDPRPRLPPPPHRFDHGPHLETAAPKTRCERSALPSTRPSSARPRDASDSCRARADVSGGPAAIGGVNLFVRSSTRCEHRAPTSSPTPGDPALLLRPRGASPCSPILSAERPPQWYRPRRGGYCIEG